MPDTRIEKIKADYLPAITHKLAHKYDVQSFMNDVIGSDPTTNGKYIRFLLDAFLDDSFLVEDIEGGNTSQIEKALSMFHKYRSKLPVEQRSLNKYKTPGDLWKAVRHFDGQMTSREEKNIERDKAYAETKVILDRKDGFKIVVPLSMFAAKWWGRGTRWCTASETRNRFFQYSILAPLIVMIMPDGRKFQAWYANTGLSQVQFMDEADNAVDKRTLEVYWPYFRCVVGMFGDHNVFPNIDYNANNLTVDEFVAIIGRHNPFDRVPKQFLTKDILCLMLAKSPYDAIKHIPSEYLTDDIFLEALKRNAGVFRFLPEHLKTRENCLQSMLALKEGVLSMVPDKFLDEDFIYQLMEKVSLSIYDVDKEYRSQRVLLQSLKNRATNFDYVSANCWLEEGFYHEVLKRNGECLQYIPEYARTFELCKIAVRQNGWALRYVGDDFKASLYLDAVRSMGCVLSDIPDQDKTEELCIEAVKQNGSAIKNVPDKWLTQEMFYEAVKGDPLCLTFMPDEYITDEMIEYVVNNNFSYIVFFPEKHLEQYHKPDVLLKRHNEALLKLSEWIRKHEKLHNWT